MVLNLRYLAWSLIPSLILASQPPPPPGGEYPTYMFSTDVCGVSIHKTDYPQMPDIATIEVGWTVPQLLAHPGEPGLDSPHISQELALCCGDDCSSRLSAGIRTSMGKNDTAQTSDLVIHFSPHQDPIQITLPVGVEIKSSDAIRIQMDKMSGSVAHVVFTKYVDPSTNLTVEVNVMIDGPEPHMTVTRVKGTIHFTNSLFVNFEKEYPLDQKSTTEPKICGDSAWWVVSDAYNPALQPFHMNAKQPERGPFSGFTPALIGYHHVELAETDPEIKYDHALPVRTWHMLRDWGRWGQERGHKAADMELCRISKVQSRGEAPMYVMYPPHSWDGRV